MAYALAEEITLTTYYPSPRGVYQELRTSGNVQIGTLDTPANPAAAPRLYVVRNRNTALVSGPAFRVDDELPAGGGSDPTPFVIDEQGNVGIGTPSPTAKLDVAGSIKIADGTQGAGKVLVSDANGLVSWTSAQTNCSYAVDSSRVTYTGGGRFTVKAMTFTKASASTGLLVRAVMSAWSSTDGVYTAGVNVGGMNYDQLQFSHSSYTALRAPASVFNVIRGLPAGNQTVNFYIGAVAPYPGLVFNPTPSDYSYLDGPTWSTFEVCEVPRVL